MLSYSVKGQSDSVSIYQQDIKAVDQADKNPVFNTGSMKNPSSSPCLLTVNNQYPMLAISHDSVGSAPQRPYQTFRKPANKLNFDALNQQPLRLNLAREIIS